MIALDTNLLVRTVLLETEWVLRSRYHQSRPIVGQLMQSLLDAEDVLVEAAWQVSLALDWYRAGADFADALHLAACGTATMHTFDRGFCKQARATGAAPPVNVLGAER